MNNYLTSTSPDSLAGIIFAYEGISRCVVLLNGPTGCKYYHAAISDEQIIRQLEFDPLQFPEKFYFGQPRVPCTYLDNHDYVFGSTNKLEEAIVYIRDNVNFDLLCIVNSPGAALIGDDLAGIAGRLIINKPVITIETPGFSSNICKGYETAVLHLINQLSLTPSNKPTPASVNILGLSLFHRNCTGDIIELKHMLKLCGITVNCILCADCDIHSIKNLPHAALNIVIHPEYALDTAKQLNQLFGTDYYICKGPPIGFAASEIFINDICNKLSADNSAFKNYCERARARAFSFISRINSLTGMPRGVTFALEGTYSELYAYTSFLVRYFGMIPVCASVINSDSDCFKGDLYALYEEFGTLNALKQDIMETNAEFVFANGNTIAALNLKKHTFFGVETALPTLGYVDVIPKTHLGVQGALRLVEFVLNGMAY